MCRSLKVCSITITSQIVFIKPKFSCLLFRGLPIGRFQLFYNFVTKNVQNLNEELKVL